jgi:hypothetical protein
MDHQRRQDLIAKIKIQGLPWTQPALPIVSLEDFFLGNDDLGSIGCNLPNHPGLATFFDTLKAIRATPQVQDVLVAITEVDEDDLTIWPFSDKVYILTSASPQAITTWVAPLHPDEIERELIDAYPKALPPLHPATEVYYVWWD